MTALPALTEIPHGNALHAILDAAEAARAALLAALDTAVRTSPSANPATVDEMAALWRGIALRQTDAEWWLERAAWSKPPVPVGRIVPAVFSMFTGDDKASMAAILARR